jgi:hypothetical protein
MKKTPTAAMLEEALVGMYRLMCTKQWKSKSNNLVTPQNLRM